MEIEDFADDAMTQFENAMNVAGYVPILSTISGGLRMTYGNIEVVGAIVAAAFLAIQALFTSDSSAKSDLFNQSGKVLVKYSLHGFANCIRSVFESVPFLSLVTCLPYDLMGNRFSYVPSGPSQSIFRRSFGG